MTDEHSSGNTSINIQISGVEETVGREIGSSIGNWVSVLSNSLDLRDLEGITIADDYPQAVKTFDLGYGFTHEVIVTDESFGTGAAIVLHPQRDHEFKSHLIMDLNLAASLALSEDKEIKVFSVAVLAHELAHVHDFRMLLNMLPEEFSRTLTSGIKDYLHKKSSPVWSEYYACRITAEINAEGTLAGYLDNFLSALDEFPKTIREKIAQYRNHRDVDLLWDEVSQKFGLLFKLAAYAIGHLAGLGVTLEEANEKAYAALKASNFLDTWIDLSTALQGMYDSYPHWQDRSVYQPIGEAFLTYLENNDMKLSELNGGLHLTVY